MALSVSEIEQLFAAARANGVLRFKLADFEAHLSDGPAHPRGPIKAKKSRATDMPTDAADLAMELRRRPIED